MRFDPPLEPARLLRRYKRFLADVVLDDGSETTVHCPNTGSMRGCMPEGARVWLSRSDNPKRKYALTWEQVETPQGHRVGINTSRANALVEEALRDGRFGWPALAEDVAQGTSVVRREVRHGDSRFDFMVSAVGAADLYIEVKSVTLLDAPGRGLFPDAVSVRAARHLRELAQLCSQGARAGLVYCVQHTGIDTVAPAVDIDPDYAAALRAATAAGVQVLAWAAELDEYACRLVRELPVRPAG